MSQVYRAGENDAIPEIGGNDSTPTTTPQGFLDYEGVKHLWSKVSMKDYPNNETLAAVINAIDETKADKTDIPSLDGYYTKTEIDSLELITIADIDTICGASIVAASEVTF